jgi:hypothetical protein
MPPSIIEYYDLGNYYAIYGVIVLMTLVLLLYSFFKPASINTSCNLPRPRVSHRGATQILLNDEAPPMQQSKLSLVDAEADAANLPSAEVSKPVEETDITETPHGMNAPSTYTAMPAAPAPTIPRVARGVYGDVPVYFFTERDDLVPGWRKSGSGVYVHDSESWRNSASMQKIYATAHTAAMRQ